MSSQLPFFHPPKTRETLSTDIRRACNTLSVRRDNNCGGIMEYVEHLARAFKGVAMPGCAPRRMKMVTRREGAVKGEIGCAERGFPLSRE